MREERKGPRVGAPEAAVQGFLKSAGLASLDRGDDREATRRRASSTSRSIERPGRPTPEVLAEILPGHHPQPSPGRNPCAGARPPREPGALRWVRPLQSIVCTFGPETEEPEIVPFAVDGIALRRHDARPPLHGARRRSSVRRFDDYAPALERAKVVLDADRRKDIILHEAKDLAFAQGLELVEDEALLEEVAGLVEWPVVLMGALRRELPRHPAGGDPRHDPREPEVLRAAARRRFPPP